jgi:polyferredoxin
VRIFLPGTKLVASLKGSGYAPVVHLVGETGIVTLKEKDPPGVFRNPEDALKAARGLVDKVEQQVRMALSKAGIEEVEN